MRLTIRTGKKRFPIFLAAPTALLAGPLSRPIVRALYKCGTEFTLSNAEARALSQGVRASAKALRKAKLPLVEIRAASGEHITVQL